MNTLAIALLSIALSVAAQFSLKAGMASQAVQEILSHPFNWRTIYTVLSDKYVLCGFLLYGLGAMVWLAVLNKWDVSKAYPLVGTGFIFTLVIGLLTGENITPYRVTGVALISIGVAMVGWG